MDRDRGPPRAAANGSAAGAGSVTIPVPVAATVADVLAVCYTHAALNLMFMEAGAPGDQPDGSKVTKCQDWLRRIRDDKPAEALPILGRLLERLMEGEIPPRLACADGHWVVDRG